MGSEKYQDWISTNIVNSRSVADKQKDLEKHEAEIIAKQE